MFPGSRFAHEPTRAECDAADEAYAQEQAAQIGLACFALAEHLTLQLDRRPSEWTADSLGKLRDLQRALMAAATAAGIAITHNEEG